MQDRAIRTLRSVCAGSVLLGSLVAACAGGDTPLRDDALEEQIANTYSPGRVGAAGGAGGSGAGGSSASGTGGSASSNAGSSGVAGGASMPGTGGSSSGACNGFAILQTKCGGPSCHGGASPGYLTNFALDEDTAAALEGGPSQGMACTADNSLLFDADNAAASLVLKKISGTANCGGQMPPGGPVLPAADVACIQTWIESL